MITVEVNKNDLYQAIGYLEDGGYSGIAGRLGYAIHSSKEDNDKYESLVRKVAKVLPEAALYMMLDAKKLPSFEYSDIFSATFNWAETPQGYAYWKIIDGYLEKCDDL